MNFRARLSLFALEERDNPGVPSLDPTVGTAPPQSSTDPALTAPTTPTTTTPTTTVGTVTTAVTGGTTAGATQPDILLQNNTVYNTPIVP